jgi:predicted chitinase
MIIAVASAVASLAGLVLPVLTRKLRAPTAEDVAAAETYGVTVDQVQEARAADAETIGLTLDQLRALATRLTADRAAELLGPLNASAIEAEINTRLRLAAYLSQLLLESGEFRYMEEIADGSAYEGRADLGNTQPGDGKRFKGRGPIQLTGRANYRRAGAALGLDLEGSPQQAATPSVGFRVAGWYWTTKGINEPADRGDLEAVTRKVNGGLNGYDSRARYYARALEVIK